MENSNAESSHIPQWKRDLIQRRRQQQNKNSINAVKLATEFGSNNSNTNSNNSSLINDNQLITNRSSENCNNEESTTTTTTTTTIREEMKERCESDDVHVGQLDLTTRGNTSGATVASGASVSTNISTISTNQKSLCDDVDKISTTPINSVASNMRFETDVPFNSALDKTPKLTAINNTNLSKINNKNTKLHEQFNINDNNTLRTYSNTKKLIKNEEMASSVASNENRFTEIRNLNKPPTIDDKISKKMSANGKIIDDCESDSSEELQYGPGIVNKLKSKYLNLTLREMNKTRVSIHRFRRAASLENLLDCNESSVGGISINNSNNDEPENKIQRKFMKKTMAASVAAKTERYRNATRGNDSIKRARSVETLMSCHSTNEDTRTDQVPFTKYHQETNDDHIVLIDRTVKIESRLSDCDQVNHRLKIMNKPKRLKPLLAETERPPDDYVKTAMKIFEGSVKKLKPKGDVAIKVATFKTINDTFKAQTMKKCIPKPPVQPKININNGIGGKTSPKKIVLMNSRRNVMEAVGKIDNPDDSKIKIHTNVNNCHSNDGVSEGIGQSVSSVVSKFKKIECQLAEPNLIKIKSTTPSPEPSSSLLSSSSSSSSLSSSMPLIGSKKNEIKPPLTPRNLSPLISSPKKITRNLDDDDNDCGGVCINDESIDQLNKNCNSSEEANKMGQSKSVDLNQENSDGDLSDKFVSKNPDQLEDDDDDDDDGEGNVDDFVDSPKPISKLALDNIGKAGCSMKYNFIDDSCEKKNYLPGFKSGESTVTPQIRKLIGIDVDDDDNLAKKHVNNRIDERLISDKLETIDNDIDKNNVGLLKLVGSNENDLKTNQLMKNSKCEVGMGVPQKQIGIIRPLVTTKIQQQMTQQQNLSNRELEKNLINRVKSIEQQQQQQQQGSKVVVSLKNTTDEIKPMKKNCETVGGSGGGGVGGGGLWDTKPWNQQNNTMVFNFSNRKDVPDYIENDGLIIRRKKEKPRATGGGIIVLGTTLDASTTDDNEWEISGGPPSPCDVTFLNDNILINGRSNLAKSPRNHKHRIQFDDTATRMFEYPSEFSMFEDEGATNVDGGTTSSCVDQQQQKLTGNIGNKSNANTTNPILGGGGLASYTPSKVDLVSEGFELGITRALTSTATTTTTTEQPQQQQQQQQLQKISHELRSNDETEDSTEKSSVQDAAWGAEATADLLY